RHLVKRLARTLQKRIDTIPSQVMQLLESYDWPGNVRELENVLERAIVLATGDLITEAELPRLEAKKPPAEAIPFRVGQPLADLEREAIQRTLRAVAGDKDAAAKILGIGVATLYRRLKEMDAEGVPDERARPTPGSP
ncbi:MAG: helix-turn-helix domain-containing protein, partial [Steroidobacteraceae bacterium]